MDKFDQNLKVDPFEVTEAMFEDSVLRWDHNLGLCKDEIEHQIRMYKADFEDDTCTSCWAENGKYFSTVNPNGKWDWYSVGGRYENELLLEDGSRATTTQIANLDAENLANCCMHIVSNDRWLDMSYFSLECRSSRILKAKENNPEALITVVDIHNKRRK